MQHHIHSLHSNRSDFTYVVHSLMVIMIGKNHKNVGICVPILIAILIVGLIELIYTPCMMAFDYFDFDIRHHYLNWDKHSKTTK